MRDIDSYNAVEIAEMIMNLDSFDTFRSTEEISREKLAVLIAEEPENIIEWLEEAEESELIEIVRSFADMED